MADTAHAGPTPARFFGAITAYQQSAALKAGIELGLFTAIAESGREKAGQASAEDIAKRCKIAPRGARILCDYLTLGGFINKTNGNPPTYTLAEDTALFLDRNSPAYVGAAAEFLMSPDLERHFGALSDRVRNGGAPSTADSSLAPNHEMWIRFARGMAGLMTLPAQMVAQHTLSAMGAMTGNRPMKVLDIAAGHGMYGIAFLQQNKQAHVVALDWPVVLPVALDHAQKLKVADRFLTLPGSAFDVPFGHDAYDVVLVPNFFHHFDAATNTGLLKKIHGALKPGGLCVTLEFAPDSDRLTPPPCGSFALVMLATTPAGDAFTVQELTGMHQEAGFGEVKSSMLPNGMQRIITGKK